MMIFWDARIAFLAVPKTGTQAYEAALADRADVILRHPPRLKHMTAQRFGVRFRPLLPERPGQELIVVAMIRNPLDWLGSWYRYRRRPALNGKPNSTSTVSFDEFVQAYLNPTPPAFADVGSQHNFLTDRAGKLAVDHLFDYADQPVFLAFLAEKFGDEVPPPERRNMSPAGDLTLSDQTRQALMESGAPDFDLYARVAAGQLLPG